MRSLNIYSLKNVFLAVFVVTLVLILYSFIVDVSLEFILNVNFIYVILSLSALFFSLIISSVRLSLLSKELRFMDSLTIWFSSQFISNITPTHSGGEILRFYAITRIANNSGKNFAIVLYEILLDVLVPNMLALFFAMFYLVAERNLYCLLPILSSTLIVTLWVSIFLRRRKIYSAILRIIERFGFLREYFDIKTMELNFSDVKLSILDHVIFIFLTLLKIVFTSFSVFLAYLAVGANIEFIRSLVAYLFALSLGIVPLPAGSIGMEAGLSIIKPGAGVVLWRILAYYVLTLICLPFILNLSKTLAIRRSLNK